MSHEQSSYQPPIIDHVPSQEELLAATKVESEYPIEHAMPREQVDVILRSMGFSTPDRSVVQPVTEQPATRPVQQYEAHHEPYVPQEHELPVSAQELKRLREQIAIEDSKTTQ